MAAAAVVAAVFAAAAVVLDELRYSEGLPAKPQIACLVLDACASVENEGMD